ncbi:MAG TPA: ATP citrate lyase citrate-binding domain-containing protein [Candidatus Paceibacterota bacterium]|nr:ATP citrate lyase citrate-binding domain-containing protein [Candidatus Paceibacterota bacterium]
MSRVKLSEYRAKKILLGDSYAGLSIRPEGDDVMPTSGTWVAKVDQGVKKRFKQGLIVVDKPAAELAASVESWKGRGFTQFILEPFFPHSPQEEQYFSMERVREGIRVLHAKDGGVDIEAHPEMVKQYLIASTTDISMIASTSQIPQAFLERCLEMFDKNFFAFLEINPLVIKNGEVHLLDAAVLVDDAGAFFTDTWNNADLVESKLKHPAEAQVEALAATTPASLKLSIINPDGALFFLLSGGGGSIVIADEAQLLGAGALIGNYGEYSGGPTRQETYLYAKEVLGVMLASKAKKKALIIAGGIANFTDMKSTFSGIIDALREVAPDMRAAGIKVFVRRGGPNETVGLAIMREFLTKENLLGAVDGSDAIITKAVDDAITFVRV